MTEFDSACVIESASSDNDRLVPRYEKPATYIRVTMIDGKTVLRELVVNGLKAYEFRNKAEAVDFIMQATSTLRY